MATGSPKRVQRVKPKSYTICLLYNSAEAKSKLSGISLATCNRDKGLKTLTDVETDSRDVEITSTDGLQLSVSDKMSCNYCDAVFAHRLDQKRHYKSDWHRYNLKMRLKGKDKVTEDVFEEISGNISSLSGSDSDTDVDTDSDHPARIGSGKKLAGSPRRFIHSGNSSTDSESDSGNQSDDIARRLPKVYFKNGDGELLSLYRCVLCHKKYHPSDYEDLVTMATDIPNHMNWAIFMAAGGHFAGAVFNKNQMVAHKTFHRYVVRAKRGTAQGSRDSQGNAPKSAGSSLRRYNEAALIQEVQELIQSWGEHMKNCDRIFLRAPSFNRKMFFSGKSPPFTKNDTRIRLIPFQTRRPTFNEVRRVYEVLASIECYGDEASLQDLVPISPPQVFNPETGQLVPRDDSQLTPRQRKMLTKKLGTSPLALDDKQVSDDADLKAVIEDEDTKKFDENMKDSISVLPEHVIDEGNISSSTASDTELVETMTTINFMELKEFACKKPKRKKKSAKKSKNPPLCHTEPDTNIMEEEKYHLKNSLYTACKVGDKETLKNLLAILFSAPSASDLGTTEGQGQIVTSEGQVIEKSESEGQSCPAVDQKDGDTMNKHSGALKQLALGGEIVVRQLCQVEHEETFNGTEGQGQETAFEKGQGQETCTNNTSNHLEVQGQESALGKGQGEETAEEKSQGQGTALEKGQGQDMCTNNASYSPEVQGHKICTNNASNNIDSQGQETPKNTEQCEDNNDCSHNTTNDELDNKSDNISNIKVNSEVHCDIIEDSGGGIKHKHLVSSTLNLAPPGTVNSLNSMWPDLSPVVTPGMLSEAFGDNKTTFLHVAAREGHVTVVTLLMEAGADPAVKDKGGLTPYMVAKDKSTRNEFRRFMGKWPDRYEYTKAQIPGPLTEEMENERKKKEAERKKLQKKQKQEQQKVQKEIEEKKRAEEREKQRFLNLSDREKRALAAEKRLVSQRTNEGAEKPVLSRCFQCGGDMTGKVPFEYCDNKFCSSKCLQVHRKSQKKS